MDCIKCDKFRFSLVCVTLLLGRLSLREKKALYVLCTMMERSSARYPTPAAYDVAVGMLYNAMASFGFSEERGGDVLLTASVDFVGGELLGEGLLQPALDFMCECLERTVIGTEYFEAVLAETLDYIRGNVLGDAGDPEAYASLCYADLSDVRYKSITDPLSFEEKQTIPDTVSAEEVFAVFEKLRRASVVYGFFIGTEEPEDVAAAVRSRFSGFERYIPQKVNSYGEELLCREDGPLGGMTRIFLGFSHGAPRAAAVLLSAYLGASPQARLYTVLREEKRYCYSVSAYCSAPGVITVSSAITPEAEEDTRKTVLEEIEKAKISIDSAVFRAARESAMLTAREVFDSRSLCESCCFSAYILGREDPFSLAEELSVLCEEDIMMAARSLVPTADYVCRGISEAAQAADSGKGARPI